jgi:hypothetical protein
MPCGPVIGREQEPDVVVGGRGLGRFGPGEQDHVGVLGIASHGHVGIFELLAARSVLARGVVAPVVPLEVGEGVGRAARTGAPYWIKVRIPTYI